jgi:hypothetical protein
MWPFKRKPPPATIVRYHSVDDFHRRFQHVVSINPTHPVWYTWDPFDEIRAWAQENHCETIMDRVIWDQRRGRWESNGIAGEDLVFIGTNDLEIATMARLKWG